MYPHNAVLLRCTSYEKGRRPFVCDTDQTRSNCLERFIFAYELPSNVKVSSLAVPPLDSIFHIVPSNANNRPSCPLLEVTLLGGLLLVRFSCILIRRKGAVKRSAACLLVTSMSFRSTRNKSIQIHALQRLILASC